MITPPTASPAYFKALAPLIIEILSWGGIRFNSRKKKILDPLY